MNNLNLISNLVSNTFQLLSRYLSFEADNLIIIEFNVVSKRLDYLKMSLNYQGWIRQPVENFSEKIQVKESAKFYFVAHFLKRDLEPGALVPVKSLENSVSDWLTN